HWPRSCSGAFSYSSRACASPSRERPAITASISKDSVDICVPQFTSAHDPRKVSRDLKDVYTDSPAMRNVTPEQAIDIALAHHRQGNLQEAEAIYRKVLAAQAEHPAALHWLAVIARQTGHKDDELTLLTRSVELNPNDALARQDLGETLSARGRFAE